MTDEARRLLELLPELIRSDETFRIKLWQVLNGEFSSKADLSRVLEQIEKSREESNRRFEESDRRFEAYRVEMNRRFDESDRRFDRIEQKLDDQKDWVNAVGGGFQNRAGRSLEDAVAGTLRVALKMTDVDPARIKMRQKIVDTSGKIGPAGRRYEIDLVITNGETWIFEVKSVTEEEDVLRFNDVADLAIETVPLPGARKALITMTRSEVVSDLCQQLGIVLG